MAVLSADGTKILNNYDRFTGVPFNAKKVTTLNDGTILTDENVDNEYFLSVPNVLGGGYAEKLNEGPRNAATSGVVGNGIFDCTLAFRKAIKNIVKNQKNINPVNVCSSLIIPAGTYLITGTIKIPSTIKLIPVGLVFFKCIGTGRFLHFTNDDVDGMETAPLFYKESYNGGELISGSQGSLIIYHTAALPNLNNPSSLNRANITPGSIGVSIGNEADNGRMVCRYEMSGLRVYGFDVALDMLPINHYIGTFYGIHLEGNNVLIRYPKGFSKLNSGENFNFINPKLAGSNTVLLYEIPAMDTNIEFASIDYNDNIVTFAEDCNGYCTVNFTGCYSERVNLSWVDEKVTNAFTKRPPVVTFSGCKFLTGKNKVFLANNMGYELNVIKGQYNIINEKSTWDLLSPDQSTLTGNNPLVKIGTFQMSAIGDKAFLVKDDTDRVYSKFNFSARTIETLVTAKNKYFIGSSLGNIGVVSIKQDPTINSTVLSILPTGTAGITITSRDFIDVNMGDVFNLGLIFKGISGFGTTDYVDPRFYLSLYDDSNTLISTTEAIQQRENFIPDVYQVNSWTQQVMVNNPLAKRAKLVVRLQSFTREIYIQKFIINKEKI